MSAYPTDIMEEVLYTSDEVKAACKRLGEQINKDYEGRPLTLVCTLKGAVMFFADLLKEIKIDCELEFIKASSYIGNTTMTVGNVQISTIMNFPVKDRDILIIEDIVDTGLTCEKLFKHFHALGCASVNMCTMLDKPSRRQADVYQKYVGYTIEDKFVIGYGLDYDEKYRNIPCVGVINKKYI